MSKKQIFYIWLITILAGGYLCSFVEDYLSSSNFFSVFEFGLMISGFAALAGVLPLIFAIYIQSKNQQSSKQKSVLYQIVNQISFTVVYLVIFSQQNYIEYIYFTLLFFSLGIILTLLSSYLWHDK